mgnify:FL=1
MEFIFSSNDSSNFHFLSRIHQNFNFFGTNFTSLVCFTKNSSSFTRFTTDSLKALETWGKIQPYITRRIYMELQMFENRYLLQQGFIELDMFEKRLSKYFHFATHQIHKAVHSLFSKIHMFHSPRIHQNNKAIETSYGQLQLSYI